MLRYSDLFYSTLHYSTLLHSTLLYSTVLSSTVLYCTLLPSTRLYSTLPYSTLRYFTHSFFINTLRCLFSTAPHSSIQSMDIFLIGARQFLGSIKIIALKLVILSLPPYICTCGVRICGCVTEHNENGVANSIHWFKASSESDLIHVCQIVEENRPALLVFHGYRVVPVKFQFSSPQTM